MTTYEDIIERVKALGIPTAEYEFTDTKQNPAPAPPFIAYFETESISGPDGFARIRDVTATVELYTDRDRDPELESKLEACFHDIDYTKTPAKISEENMFYVSYEFELKQKIKQKGE